MEPKYSLRNLTPPEMCTSIACPQVYDLEEISSEDCTALACAGVYQPKNGKEIYVIVGTKLSPKDVGLEGRVGEGETVIEIPKGVLKNLIEK